jgi:formylglycine-generating enzyme required for sulfatase activity
LRWALSAVVCSGLAGLLGAAGPAAQAAVIIDWVTVPGTGTPNAPDDTGFGSVADTYLIGKYEVMNAQYAEFLNAVAATDTNGLYNSQMSSAFGGITQFGSSGSYTYSTIAGRESMPMNWLSFYEALRFANWLHNGQPMGAQGNATTEDGAYTITAQGIADNSITRSAGARIFLTSEDEWYKAAYYDAQSISYFDYPAGSDTPTTCALPGATVNTANCDDVVGDLTDVGSYTGSPSAAGTFDQGGNVHEWTEAIRSVSFRVSRGGSFESAPSILGASFRGSTGPGGIGRSIGFRVAMIPEPSTALLLAGGLLGLALRRRLSA